MGDYHEPYEALDPRTRDEHRALTSLKEEIEAVDWYNQRVALCTDAELRDVLAHNRDEEVEHACMTLEWLRRNIPHWDQKLRTYLFSEGPIRDVEKAEEERGGTAPAPAAGGRKRDLGIGSLRGGGPATTE